MNNKDILHKNVHTCKISQVYFSWQLNSIYMLKQNYDVFYQCNEFETSV